MIQQAATALDFYKTNHKPQYPEGSNNVFSNFTPRSSRLFNGSSLYDDKVLNFGFQRVAKDFLIDSWNDTFFNASKEKAVGKYKRRMDTSLGEGVVSISHIEDLHDLGYLPIIIKALPEGRRSSIKVPVFTITSTIDEYFWLVNYLESVLSTESWKSITMATTAYEFRRVFEHYAELTGAPKEFIKFQGHDFSMRGLSNREEAYKNSIAHLTCFVGTDTISAIDGAEDFYNADAEKELIGTSVNASEHSTITMSIAAWIISRQKDILKIETDLPETNNWKSTEWQLNLIDAITDDFKYISTPDGSYYEIIDDWCVKGVTQEFAESHVLLDLDNLRSRRIGEKAVLENMITEVFPSGIYSHVSDSYDYWYMLTHTVKELKDVILSRTPDHNGLCRTTFRPDSGDPESIICGLKIYELEIDAVTEGIPEEHLNKDQIVNYANNTIQTSYYDGFKYKNMYYDFNGNVLSQAEVDGSLNILWDIFGGKVNDKGFKVINPMVGLIYGDSITIVRQESILKRMVEMGFSSENIVFGIGSFSYQYVTRDTFGFAMKATYGEVDGKSIEIFKDPKTDSGIKKSAKGLLTVHLSEEKDGDYVLIDQCTKEEEASEDNELLPVFLNGKLVRETTLEEIRSNVEYELSKIVK